MAPVPELIPQFGHGAWISTATFPHWTEELLRMLAKSKALSFSYY
jgi:hypothetical protein